MRILQVHNRYRQPGGEDVVVDAERSVLEAHGHEVLRYEDHNERIDRLSRTRVATETVWSDTTRQRITAAIGEWRADIVHCHNTFPLISPAAYRAAADAGLPVVQTLHNYRLVCPSANLFREGRPCCQCVGRSVAWPAVVHGCYRGRAASAVVATMLAVHAARGTWREGPTAYLALNEFARAVFVEGGLPPDRISIVPNFVAEDPGPGDGSGGYFLFAGRLSEEKGVATLLSAWERIGDRVPLRITGDGPLAGLVRAAAERNPAVTWLGWQPRADVMQLMRDAVATVVPSVWHEPFGLVVIESLAAGTPVVAADSGGLAELVEHGVTGRVVPAGHADALAAAVLDLSAAGADERLSLRSAARKAYAARHTADHGYSRLVAVYERALGRRGVVA